MVQTTLRKKDTMSAQDKLKPLLTDRYLWKLLEDYVTDETSRLVTKLLNCRESELKHLQGQVQALDTLVRLRSQLITDEQSRRSNPR